MVRRRKNGHRRISGTNIETEVSVPDVMGLSESKARKALDKSNLSVSVDEEYSSSVDRGNVIAQSIDAGTLVSESKTVIITVSKGSKPSKPGVSKNSEKEYDRTEIAVESETDNSETEESETDESETTDSETDDSETDDSETIESETGDPETIEPEQDDDNE